MPPALLDRPRKQRLGGAPADVQVRQVQNSQTLAALREIRQGDLVGDDAKGVSVALSALEKGNGFSPNNIPPYCPQSCNAANAASRCNASRAR